MAFIAECPFCHVMLQKVPDQRAVDGVAAFLLGSLAVCAATILQAFIPTLILAGLGLLFAVIGLGSAAQEKGRNFFPLAGSIVSLGVILLALVRPTFLGLPAWGRDTPDHIENRPIVIPLADRARG